MVGIVWWWVLYSCILNMWVGFYYKVKYGDT
jgi:hypothetical protein